MSEILWFVEPVLGLDLESVETATLPGDGTVSYRGVKWCYQLYPEEVLEIVNACLNPYEQPMTLEDLHMFQAP